MKNFFVLLIMLATIAFPHMATSEIITLLCKGEPFANSGGEAIVKIDTNSEYIFDFQSDARHRGLIPQKTITEDYYACDYISQGSGDKLITLKIDRRTGVFTNTVWINGGGVYTGRCEKTTPVQKF